MQKTAHPFTDSQTAESPSVCDLERYAESWVIVGQISQLSPRTLENRRRLLEKLFWFLKERGRTRCGLLELREFIAYLARAHQEPTGRYGGANRRQALRPVSVATYHKILRTFFRFLVEEGALAVPLMEKVPLPMARLDQIQPFTPPQVAALHQAARRSRHPRRDEAIVLLLLDTGVRASELCGLKLKDLDLQGHRCTVLGEGMESLRGLQRPCFANRRSCAESKN